MINIINESACIDNFEHRHTIALKYQGYRHRCIAEFVMIQFLTEISLDFKTIPNFLDLHLKLLQNISQKIRVF